MTTNTNDALRKLRDKYEGQTNPPATPPATQDTEPGATGETIPTPAEGPVNFLTDAEKQKVDWLVANGFFRPGVKGEYAYTIWKKLTTEQRGGLTDAYNAAVSQDVAAVTGEPMPRDNPDAPVIDWLISQGLISGLQGQDAYAGWDTLSDKDKEGWRKIYQSNLQAETSQAPAAKGKEDAFIDWLGAQGDWKYYTNPAIRRWAFSQLPEDAQKQTRDIFQASLPEEAETLPEFMGGTRVSSYGMISAGNGALFMPMIDMKNLNKTTAAQAFENVYYGEPGKVGYTKLKPQDLEKLGLTQGRFFAIMNDDAMAKWVEDKTGTKMEDLRNHPSISALFNQATEKALQGNMMGATDLDELAGKIQRIAKYVPDRKALKTWGYNTDMLGVDEMLTKEGKWWTDPFHVNADLKTLMDKWSEAATKPDFNMSDQRAFQAQMAGLLNKTDTQTAVNYLSTISAEEQPYVLPQAMGGIFNWLQNRVQTTLPTAKDFEGMVQPSNAVRQNYMTMTNPWTYSPPSIAGLQDFITQAKDAATKGLETGANYGATFGRTMAGLMGIKDVYKENAEAEAKLKAQQEGARFAKTKRELEERQRLASATPERMVKL